MSTLERLRGIVGSRPAKAGPYVPSDDPSDEDIRGGRLKPAHDIAEILGGEWQGSEGSHYLVVERSYGPGHRHGHAALMDHLPPEEGIWPRLELLLTGDHDGRPGLAPGRLMFFDLETTGLAGGAGTYAFLVGCGWFDGPRFRVRQYFLSDFAAERALLRDAAAIAAGSVGVVTYNGKTFDLPLMDTRFVLNRLENPFTALPHLDMLHPARRLWRSCESEAGESGCRLTALEQMLCGHTREGDVPGFEIPSRYFHYVRSGDARPLVAVLEHNRLDILSLALVTAHAARLLEEGAGAAQSAREALGLGRLYERARMTPDARAAFARAAGVDREALPADSTTRVEALRAYAVFCRRERRHADAAVAWSHLLEMRSCPPHIARQAAEALAVHHEHRARDLDLAHSFALRTLQLDTGGSTRQSLEHRLARLDRKLGRDKAQGQFRPTPLF